MSALLATLDAGLAYGTKALPYLECISLISALEYNRYAIRRRQIAVEKTGKPLPAYIACCIGYKETRETFEACLRSYKSHAKGCTVFFTMLDGSFEENDDMTSTFAQQFGTGAKRHIRYDQPLGQMYEEVIRTKIALAQSDLQAAERDAFAYVYGYVEKRIAHIIPSLLEQMASGLPALLVSQPHVGMKEVRFAAWMTSIVLADVLKVGYMWSLDSDSCITESCIPRCISAIVGGQRVGASSASLAVRDRESSWFNRLYGGYYQCVGNLRWSSTGCIGKSNCIQGPSACYRIEAIKPVVGAWYSQRICGQKVWVNEDLHMTALVSRNGWSTLFVVNAVVLSEAVASFKAWFKQTMRWERGPHFERLATPWTAFRPSQGPIRVLSNLRDLTMDPYIFVYLIHVAVTGRGFPSSNPQLGAQLMISVLVQRIWSVARTPEMRGNWLGAALAAVLYLFAYPFNHVWGLCTLMDDTWESSTKRLSTPTIGPICFAIWIAISGAAVARLIFLF